MDTRGVPLATTPPSASRMASQERRPRTQMMRPTEPVRAKLVEPAFRHHKDMSRYMSDYRNKYTLPRTKRANSQRGGATTRQSSHWPAIKILLENGWRHSVKSRNLDNEHALANDDTDTTPKPTQSVSSCSLDLNCDLTASTSDMPSKYSQAIPLPWPKRQIGKAANCTSSPQMSSNDNGADNKFDSSLSADCRLDERKAATPLHPLCNLDNNERLCSPCSINIQAPQLAGRSKSKSQTPHNDTPRHSVCSVQHTLTRVPSACKSPSMSVSVCNINDTALPSRSRINSRIPTMLRTAFNFKNDTPLLSMCHNNEERHSTLYNNFPTLPSVCNMNDIPDPYSSCNDSSGPMHSVCNINDTILINKTHSKPTTTSPRRSSSLNRRPASQILRPTRLPSTVMNGILTQKPRANTPSTPRKSDRLPSRQTLPTDYTGSKSNMVKTLQQKTESVTEAIRRLKHSQWRVPQLRSGSFAEVFARRQRCARQLHCTNTNNSYRVRQTFWTVR